MCLCCSFLCRWIWFGSSWSLKPSKFSLWWRNASAPAMRWFRGHRWDWRLLLLQIISIHLIKLLHSWVVVDGLQYTHLVGNTAHLDESELCVCFRSVLLVWSSWRRSCRRPEGVRRASYRSDICINTQHRSLSHSDFIKAGSSVFPASEHFPKWIQSFSVRGILDSFRSEGGLTDGALHQVLVAAFSMCT